MALSKEEKIIIALMNAPDDSEINYEDIPKLTKEQKLKPADKIMMSIRMDRDVLDYYKSKGKGYQKLIKEVLRQHMCADFLEIKKEVQPQMKVMHAYESQIAEFRNTMIELASEVHAQTSEIHKLKEERSTLSKYSKNLMDSLTENIEMMKAH